MVPEGWCSKKSAILRYYFEIRQEKGYYIHLYFYSSEVMEALNSNLLNVNLLGTWSHSFQSCLSVVIEESLLNVNGLVLLKCTLKILLS